jgi:hypothetical protein
VSVVCATGLTCTDIFDFVPFSRQLSRLSVYSLLLPPILLAGPPAAHHCILTPIPQRMQLSQTVPMGIAAKDRFGNECVLPDARAFTVVASWTSARSGDIVTVACLPTTLDSGVVTASLELLYPGFLTLSVTVNSEHCICSPAFLFVTEAHPDSFALASMCTQEMVSSSIVGRMASFVLEARSSTGTVLQYGGDHVVASGVFQPSGLEVAVSVRDEGDGTYTCSYTPLHEGTLIISCTVAGQRCPAGCLSVTVCSRGVFVWGANSEGNLGTGDALPRLEPTLLRAFCNMPPVISVAAGYAHSALVLDDGSLYTFGQGMY